MFSDDCYKFYSDNNVVPSFDDQSHRYLFDFVSVDLQQIEVLLEKFFFEMFDFTKLKLKENRPRKEFTEKYKNKIAVPFVILEHEYVENAYLKKIINILESSHPYYRIGENAQSATEAILIDYFHLHSSYNEDVFTKNDYISIVEDLLSIPPLVGYFFTGRLEKLYEDYKRDYDCYRRIRRKKRMRETKLSINIVTAQQRMKELLFRVLDISTPVINRLSIYERIWLYKKLQSKKPLSDADIQKLSACASKNITLPKGKEFDKEFFTFITKFPLHEVFHYDFAPECSVKLTILDDGNDVCDQLSVESLEQLLQWEFMKMVKVGARIKKCENCGKYFFVRDNKNNYCDREIKDGITCLDVGPSRRFVKQKKNDIYYTAYRKAYNMNTARANKYCKTKKIAESALKNWRKEAKKRLSDVYADEAKNNERFYQWLNLTNEEINDLE